jgi:hyperosmotically inducible periplasmic protein
MMNSNSTPKIVVGIGLAAVFGVGVSIFAVRAKQESEIARTAPPAAVAAQQSDQSAADTTAPVPGAPAPAPSDQSTSAPSAQGSAPTTSVTPAPTPAATALSDSPDADKSKPSKRADRAERRVARAPSTVDMSVSRVASANRGASDSSDSVNNAQQAAVVAPSGDATSNDATASNDAGSSVPTGTTADASSAPAQSGRQAVPASDSQITADVKTEIAAAAPDTNVIVTTNNGVVALAGSAPSQNEAEQAKQAAQRVAGIGHVDASGLTVINQ